MVRVPIAVAMIMLEGAKPYGGVDVVGGPAAGDNAMPDVTGQPGSNQFVRPQSVPPQNVIGAGTELGTWQSTVVERGKQVWWPGELPRIGLSGSVGTAGGERPLWQAGRHEVPAFWRFFLSYAIGKAAGTF